MKWYKLHDEIAVGDDVLVEVCEDLGWEYVLRPAAVLSPEMVTRGCERRYGVGLIKQSTQEEQLIAVWWTPRQPELIARGISTSAALRSIVGEAQGHIMGSARRAVSLLGHRRWAVYGLYSLSMIKHRGRPRQYGLDTGRIGFALLDPNGYIVAAWWGLGQPSFIDHHWDEITEDTRGIIAEAHSLIDVRLD